MDRALLAALLVAPAAQEAPPAAPAAHREQADRAQAMVDRLEGGERTAASLAAARALREELLAAGNHRSADFLAGRIVALFPEQVRDHHRYVEILLVRGYRDRAERALADLLRDRPSDCTTYGILSDLLLESGRPVPAMEVHAGHLREHPGEAGPLNARAWIALNDLRDAAAAREAAKEMLRAADRPGGRPDVAEWLRRNAAGIEEGAARQEKDAAVLGAAARRLDRVLWGTFLGFAVALAAAGWFTRRRA